MDFSIVHDVERPNHGGVHFEDDRQNHACSGSQRLIEQRGGGVAGAGCPTQVVQRHLSRDVIHNAHAVGGFCALVEHFHIEEDVVTWVHRLSLARIEGFADREIPDAWWEDDDIRLIVVVFVTVVVVEFVIVNQAVVAWNVVWRAVHINDGDAIRIFRPGDFSKVVQRLAFSSEGNGVGDAHGMRAAWLDRVDDQTSGSAVDLSNPVRAESGIEHQADRCVVNQSNVVHCDVPLIEDFDVERHFAACLDRVGLVRSQRLAQGEVILRIVEPEVHGQVGVCVQVSIRHWLAVVQQRDREGLDVNFAEHFHAIAVAVVVVVRINPANRCLKATGRSDADNVVARSEVVEFVFTIDVGVGRRNEHAFVVLGWNHVRIEQFHFGCCDSWFAQVLQTVMILIEPDEVAEAKRRTDVSGIPCHVVLASDEHGGDGATSDWISIAVFGVVGTCVELTEFTSVNQRGWEAEAVSAGLQIDELIITKSVGDIRADGHAIGIIEHDADKGDAGFTSILDTIAVQVLPDAITNAGVWGEVSDIPCWIIFASDQLCQR